MKLTYDEVERRTRKTRDTWVRRLFCDPITAPLTYLLHNYTNVTPMQVTVATFLTWMGAAAAFGTGSLILGVVLYFIGFLLDGTDGKMSRVKELDDSFRGTTDFMLDGVSCVAVTIGLAVYAWDATFAFLLLLWVNLHLFEMNATSTMYRLKAAAGITDEYIVSPEMEKVYRQKGRSLLTNIIIGYHRAVDKLAGLRTYPHPTMGEAAFLIFIVGPALWFTTGDLIWMNAAVVLGMLCILTETVGACLVVYTLIKEDKADFVDVLGEDK